MIRLFPKIEQEDLIIRLFHRAVDAQWSSDELDWDAPLGLTERQAVALAKIITPVYLGEQSAMNGASRVLQQLIQAGETSAQLYLSTFLLDEARHFEALTRLYRHVGSHPLQLRELPAMLRYHHRLQQGDRVDWLWGILISDLFAREFYLTFAKVQPNALFGQMSTRILRDESRHQAFAHTYLKAAIPALPAARRLALVDMKDELIEIMEDMNRVLRPETDVLDFDSDAFFKDLIDNIEAHAQGIGLSGPGNRGGDGSDGAGRPADRYRHAADWSKILAAKRRQALDGSGGVQWPGASIRAARALALGARGPAQQRWEALRALLAAEPGRRAASEAAGRGGRLDGDGRDPSDWTFTEADLRFLVGRDPLPRRQRRRLFGAAHPIRQLASCAGCAVAVLCRTRLVRAAAAHPA